MQPDRYASLKHNIYIYSAPIPVDADHAPHAGGPNMYSLINFRITLKKSHAHLHIVGNVIVKFA